MPDTASTRRPPGPFDVMVCGGGPAGLGAALAAARSGARTFLAERHGALGGLWTTGLVTPVFDTLNKRGLTGEIRAAMAPLGLEGAWHNPDQAKANKAAPIYPPGHMAALFDRLIAVADVTVQLHTIADDVEMDGDRVVGVAVHSKSGPQVIRADVVIDCTGDGDIAAAAGCEYHMGRDEDNACQPATLYALVGGAPRELIYPEPIVAAVAAAKGELSYAHPYLFPVPGAPGVAIFMCTHLYTMDATDAAAVSAGEMEGRRQILRAIDWLRAGDPMFADLFLIQFAGQIGIRESRRILGRHYLTAAEVQSGCRFDDAVCAATFNIDIHDVSGADAADRGLVTQNVPAYEIPYGCLLPRDRRGLLVAGRCISGDHTAHASYRVTGNAAALGEAAGVAAAMACRRKCDPAELDGRVVRAELDQYYEAFGESA
jgi:2-polyprenyl-6-methoxyphenol hydroxylase-like FAD-dependent oxidoreductase